MGLKSLDYKATLWCGVASVLCLLSACGRMPVPVMEPEVVFVPMEPLAVDTKVERQAAVRVVAMPRDDALVRVSAPVPLHVAETENPETPLRSITMLIDDAVEFLRSGQVAEAREVLGKVLEQNANHVRALDLFKQMDESPVSYFGTTAFFTYALKQNESLSLVADRFLDDPIKFFILARFNNINNPSQVGLGQRIRIPGEPPDELKQTQVSASLESADFNDRQSQLHIAQQYVATGKHLEGVAILQGLLREQGFYPPAAKLLATTVKHLVLEQLKSGSLEQAVRLLDENLLVLPENSILLEQKNSLEDRRLADELYRSAQESITAGKTDEAYHKLLDVLARVPDHKQARSALVLIKGDVVDLFHRQAMSLYRQQQLDDAIALWDELLTLDGQHHLAGTYRSRAVELKRRLEVLKDKGKAPAQ